MFNGPYLTPRKPGRCPPDGRDERRQRRRIPSFRFLGDNGLVPGYSSEARGRLPVLMYSLPGDKLPRCGKLRERSQTYPHTWPVLEDAPRFPLQRPSFSRTRTSHGFLSARWVWDRRYRDAKATRQIHKDGRPNGLTVIFVYLPLRGIGRATDLPFQEPTFNASSEHTIVL